MSSNSNNEKKNKSKEKHIRKKRITINIDEIYSVIINSLKGILGRSTSSIVYFIIRQWITQNSEMIRNTYNVDLPGITRQVLAERLGLEIDKELNTLARSIIEELPELFETIKSISAKELAEILNIDQKSLIKTILLHPKELQKIGLNIIYDRGFLSKV